MISIGAMSIFMTLGWNALGGWGGFVTALLYAVLALSLTHWFLARKQLEIPAGITATLAVVMVPLAIFGAQMALGYWGESKPFRDYHVFIDWRWIMMEFGTLAVGAILLRRYRFPFMLMPVAVTLWYMSMDIVPFLFGAERVYDWEIRKFISLWFGLAMVLVAFWVDLRSRLSRDYAFWLYLFGVLAFWGLGVAGYLGYLSYEVFKDSMIFPLALSLVGLAIIGLGVLWQRREARWSARLRGFLPDPLRELIDARGVR